MSPALLVKKDEKDFDQHGNLISQEKMHEVEQFIKKFV